MRRLDVIERRPISLGEAQRVRDPIQRIEAELVLDPAMTRRAAEIDARFGRAPSHPFLEELRRVAKHAILVDAGRGGGRHE